MPIVNQSRIDKNYNREKQFSLSLTENVYFSGNSPTRITDKIDEVCLILVSN